MTIQTAATSPPDELTATAMRDALAAARSGRFAEACAIAERALAAGANPVPINTLLGMARLDLGETERAVAHLEFAHAQRPSDTKIATDLARALASLGHFDRAFEVADHDLALADPTLQLARLRGAIAVQLSDFGVAIEALEHVVRAVPNDWESWNNLGNAFLGAEQFDRSAEAYERALALNPQYPDMRMNYANALRNLRRVDEAEALYRGLANEFAEAVLPLRQLHFLLKDAGRDQEALEAIEGAIARAPDNVDLLADKATHLGVLQKMNEAEAVYRQVLEIDPANERGYVGVALVLELTNRTAELPALADEAEQRGIGAAVNFIRAYHYSRTKQFEKGIASLDSVPDQLEPVRQLHLRGQLLEGAGRYDEAFAAFNEMNAISRKDLGRPEDRAAAYREMIRGFRKKATKAWAGRWRAESKSDARNAPVFLVGFPRSGTTLLDTILMSHPRVEVLEEEPPLRTAMQLLPSFADLPILTDEQVEAARDLYFDAVASLRPIPPGKLLVDKNPLTMNLLPFVHRMFPDARIILALRHPCDVVLSCFMANFRLNEGMSSFVRLDTTAELYDLSFGYYEHVQSLMPFSTHVVKYENLVADRETELRALFDFLGLDWHDAVLDHQETAKKRGRIKTASYAQVVEPIYTRSAGRWEKYRKHLEPVLPVLKPWIDKFGYSA